MIPLGVYRPGTSVLHRLPAGVKLLALAVGVVVLLTLDSPVALGVAAGAVAVGYAVAGVPLRVAAAQLRPMLWVAVVLVALQWWLVGWPTALTVVTRLLTAVAAAALVTLTTRVTAVLEAFQRALQPVRRTGVRPDRVALVLALTLRGVPVVADIVGTVREAHQARGASAAPWRLLVPVLVRVLRYADALGDALVARGVDDEDPPRTG